MLKFFKRNRDKDLKQTEGAVKASRDRWFGRIFGMLRSSNLDDAQWEELERSDHHAMTDGWVSVTPLHTDMTNHDALTLTESLSLE